MAYKFEKSGKRISVSTEELEASEDDGSYVIVLDCGNAFDGKAYWCYIAIPSTKYREFTRLAAQRAIIRLNDYGKILRDGYDRKVPFHAKQEMEALGCDEAYMAWLKEDAAKMREEFSMGMEVPTDKHPCFVARLKKKTP